MTFLKELLRHENPRAQQYNVLIEEAKRNNFICNAPFVSGFTTIMEKRTGFHEFLKKKLEGKILVDLGCGTEESREKMISLARRYGVRHLISTDFIYVMKEEEKDLGDIRVSILNKDMLDLVMRLPHESVSFFLSGIDTDISDNETYNRALAEEMRRALHPNGIAITFQAHTTGTDIRYFLREIGCRKLPNDFLDNPTEIMLRMLEIFEK